MESLLPSRGHAHWAQPRPTKLRSGHWTFGRSLGYTPQAPAWKGTQRQQGQETGWCSDSPAPHSTGDPARGGIFVTQCRKDATRRPYDETGSHGFRVAEHRLGGNEDPGADDGAHDDADAAEQAHLVRRKERELVLRRVQLRWPAAAPCPPPVPGEALAPVLSPSAAAGVTKVLLLGPCSDEVH